MPKSHKIASRQAELARKKRKHHDSKPEELQASAASVAPASAAQAPQVPDEVRARPSLMSSYRAVATQPGSAKPSSPAARATASSNTAYFSADLRRLMITIAISFAILAGLTFALR